MKKALTLLLVFITIVANAQYGDKDIRAYVEQYSSLAMQKMKEYKIPASITMAQAILESACGTSRLAREGNNHFGIKCHKEWNGDTLLKDDDAQSECFRKYDRAEESFDDHSLFLTTRYRYNALFQLNIMDYKAWARGLKEAGYATSPEYPTRLINLIERYQLAALDSMTLQKWHDQTPAPTSANPPRDRQTTTTGRQSVASMPPIQTQPQPAASSRADAGQQKGSQPNCFTAAKGQYPKENYPFTDREVYVNNSTLFVIASAGDTYASIAADVQDTEAKLRKYNDVGDKVQPSPNEVIYIEYKSKYNDIRQCEVVGNETLHYISQKYAVRILYLLKYNNSSEMALHQGDIVLLKEKTQR
jgi:hypothetical protein